MRCRRLAAVLCLAAPLCRPADGAGVRKLYTERGDGVSFLFPANWLLNGDDDAATAKLRIADAGQPHAVVQLEGNFAGEGPYAGTDFEAGAFAYTVVATDSAEACFALLDRDADDTHKPERTVWKGYPAARLEETFTVAGTDDIHRLVAVYRPAQCLLFETVLIRKSVGMDIAPLPAARWHTLHAAFDEVLNSVRLGPPSAKR